MKRIIHNIEYFFNKYEQIHKCLRVCEYLLKTSLNQHYTKNEDILDGKFHFLCKSDHANVTLI